jgi:HD-like signal output (HDOD) protein
MVATAAPLNPKLDLEVLLTSRLDADKLRLPPYPAIALKLQQLASSGRHSSRDLCATVNADAALVAAVLRRANAAASGPATVISSLEAAVNRIGIEELLRLALAQSVGVTASASGPLASLRRDAWRMSLLAARIGLELAERRGISQDEAFVAGLLHDFGAIAVLVGLEDLKVELPVLPATTWKILVDRLHVKFGSVIAKRWHLPEPIVDAIQHHHAVAAYAGPHRALVELVATVDHINTIFDRAPTTSVAALLEVPGLSQDERYRIGAMIPQISEYMASFEAAASPAREVKARTVVAKPVPGLVDDGWPIELVVTTARDVYQACAMSPNAIAFRGAAPLLPNWLTQMTLGSDPELAMLVNVKTCEPQPDGTYLMTAQPFGLDGKEKQIWFHLVQRTRPVS